MAHERKKKLSRRSRQMRIEELKKLTGFGTIYRYKERIDGNVEIFCREPEGRYGLTKIVLSKEVANGI